MTGFGLILCNPESSEMAKNKNDSEANFLQLKQETFSHGQERRKKKYVQAPPQCKLCLVRFKNYSRIETHMKQDHPEAEKTVFCEVCRKPFHTRSIMMCHLRQVHRKKKDRDELAEKHKDTRIMVKDSQCHICGLAISKKNLKEHVNSVHLKKKEACEYCGKEYMAISGLKYHLLNKHPEKSKSTKKQCHKCEKSFVKGNELRSHLYKVHKETIQCEFCDEEFAMPLQLKRHLTTEHPTELEEMEKERAGGGSCQVCEKYFSSKFGLRQHARSHDVPSFKCDICNKDFTSKQALMNHKIYVHDNIKLYSCNICHKEFKHNKGLMSHQLSFHQVKMANNEEPCKVDKYTKFNCSVCLKYFTTNQSLKRHVVRRHEALDMKSIVPEVTEEHPQSQGARKKDDSDEEGGNEVISKETTFQSCEKSKSEDQVSVQEENEKEKYDPMTDLNGKNFESQYLLRMKVIDNPIDTLTDTKVKNEPIENETDLLTKEQTGPKPSFFKAIQEDEIYSEDIKYESIDEVTEDVLPDLNNPLSPFDGEESEENHKSFAGKAENDVAKNERIGDQVFSDEAQIKDDANEKSRNNTFNTEKKVKRKFSCQVCQKEFSSNQSLMNHVAKCHPDAMEGGDKKCNNCGKTFLTAQYLDRHKILVHPGGEKCTFCFEEFSTESRLEKHIRSRHPKEYTHLTNFQKERPRVDCKICGKDFNSKAALKVHIKQLHEGQSRFCCDHCKEKFKTPRKLNHHIMSDHPNLPRIECEICEKEFAIQACLSFHKYQIHSGLQHCFKCKKCDFKCKSSAGSEKHMAEKHPESDKVQCDICGKQWFLKQRLNDHCRKKHGKKPGHKYLKKGRTLDQCNICGKSFNTPSYLTRHVKTVHNKEKPHECEYCEKTFSQKSLMKVHMDAVHLKVKKHQCPDCGEAFTLKMYLKSHIIFKHTEKAFTCQYCGKDFATKQSMERHIQTMHLKLKPYSCHICDAQFSTAEDMQIHVKCTHS